jgi:hypothetical protein
MLSFIKKTNIDTSDIVFYLKYNIPFEDGLITHFYNDKRIINRLPEILSKSKEFNIYSWDLKYLPNNIDNPNLNLKIWGYSYQKLPENWNIGQIGLTFSGDFKRFINNSFKIKRIKNHSNDKIINL